MKTHLTCPAILIAVVLYCLISCGKTTPLDHALTLSGKNRSELEKVLDHCRNDPNPLKLKSAEFLIENMPGHTGVVADDELLEYRRYVLTHKDLKNALWDVKNIYLGHPYRTHSPHLADRRQEDVQIVTSDFLIANIEVAFGAWEKPWARHLSFEEFCEYILPYRIENEPLEYWRDSLADRLTEQQSLLFDMEEFEGSAFWACHFMNEELIKHYKWLIQKKTVSRNPVAVEKFGCADFVYGTLFVMRANGAPVAMDFTPQWPDRRNPHFWTVLLDNHKRHVPFMGYDEGPTMRHKPDHKYAKVYRKTDARNPDALCDMDLDEPIPSLFESPFLKDVTEEYTTTADIEVRLTGSFDEPQKIAYLCVFDNEEWIPLDWGRVKGSKVAFRNVGDRHRRNRRLLG